MVGIQCIRLASWLAVAVLTWFCGSALAVPRVALVIGNSDYAHAPTLANPVNDAMDIGAALTRLGFTVTRIENAGYATFRRGLLEFQQVASASEVAVVFYAGHGIEVGQRNFLVPVDARLASEQNVEFEAVPLELVSLAVERASRLRLVILDACRENPFAMKMQRAGATRSVGRGLARVEPSGETLVAYAAKEGTVAADGSGRNSPYSEALLAHLEEPGLEVGLMFRKVRDAVLASTGGRQEPFTYGSLSSRGAYLGPRPASGLTTPVAAGSGKSGSASERLAAEQLAAKRLAEEKELEFWKSVKDSDDPADIQAYRDRYPGGTYEVLARNRLTRLETPRQERERPPDITFSINWDDARYRWAKERNTKEAYREYLTEYPSGRHAGEARRRLKGLSVVVGRRFRDCAECPELVVVAAGSYEMGSPLWEEGRNDNEGPVHRVEIGEPFAVGVYEVTVGEFGRFVEETGHSAEECGIWGDTWKVVPGWSWRRPGFDQSERHPVVCVNWEDAQAFARWLSSKTGKGYRLLSESEWEYVARGGTQTPWYWGGSEVGQCQHGNGADEALKRRFGETFTMSTFKEPLASCDDGHAHGTSPGGTYKTNGIGLYDVIGNVWEWVEDCWHNGYKGAPSDGSAWITGGDCSWRGIRGGSWADGVPMAVRSASRDWGHPAGGRDFRVGFRVARRLD